MVPRRHERRGARRPYARTKGTVGIRPRQREEPTNPQPGLDERKPGNRLLPAAAVAVAAVAVGLVAVAVRRIAVVGGIAVVAVGGLAVAIPATISTISAVAVVISGGSLGGDEAAERGDCGDCDEGFLEGVHVHSPNEMSNRAARPTRRTSHRNPRLKMGQTPFCLGGVPPKIHLTRPGAAYSRFWL